MGPAWKRRVYRGLTWAGSLLLLLAALCLFGWRYGFTPLPPVSAPIRQTSPDSVASATTNPSSERSSLQRMVDTLTAEEAALPLMTMVADNIIVGRSAWTESIERWSRTGELSVGERSLFCGWIAAHPLAAECQKSLLAAPMGPPISPLEDPARSALARLTHVSVLTVATSMSEGQPESTFDAFARAWRLRARWVSRPLLHSIVDERGVAQFEPELGRPFRGWVDRLPRLPRATGKAWMAELAALTEALPPVDLGLEESLLGSHVSEDMPAPAGETPLAEAIRNCAAALVFDARVVGQSIFHRLLLESPLPEAQSQRGVAFHVLRESLQNAVARPADREHMTRAWTEAARERLEKAEAPGEVPLHAKGWPDREQWSTWRRELDRPAIWDDAPDFSRVDQFVEERRIWRTQLDACRLALALKLYHDTHGRFPVNWEAMVPDYLPVVPRDRFTNRTYGYESQADEWTLWVVDHTTPEAGSLHFRNRAE